MWSKDGKGDQVGRKRKVIDIFLNSKKQKNSIAVTGKSLLLFFMRARFFFARVDFLNRSSRIINRK